MRIETFTRDIAVIGGGLAGVCAAIGAARQGASVVLAQNRPVLGGNSSSEVRVWVCGATAHGVHPYARETGIMGELWVENQFRNPEGNPYYWDLLLLEKVRAEPNITLLLNTEITEVRADGPVDARTIRSVAGWQSGSELWVTIEAPTFIDCSGDGLIGFRAGAEYSSGRESRSLYGEQSAPETPDSNTLGSTILFYSKDIGRPSKFFAPPFAKDISATAIPERRLITQTMNGCDFWWIEWGGELDVVADNELIRDELHAVIYGLWDYIKNSGKFSADNLTLEWVGAVPGKREYRRFTGDHVLTQTDVLDQTLFEDRIAHGGWSIDLHPVGGVYASEEGSRHLHPDGNYHIPLRSLYSKNITNMWMAGRNVSASHVAFATVRVMATCAILGEAAGVAAAVAHSLGVGPRALVQERMPEVHRALVRADASVLGLMDEDPDNLALSASASASSTKTRLESVESQGVQALVSHLALVVPADPSLDGLQVLIDADEDSELTADLFTTSREQNYLPHEKVNSVTVPVSRGRSWVTLPLAWMPDTPANGVVVLHAAPSLSVHRGTSVEPGTLVFVYREVPPGEEAPELWRHWKQILLREGICFRLSTQTSAFAPSRAIGGFARPYGGPNEWVSAPLAADPQPTLELRWVAPVEIGRVDLVFDDDLNEDLINLHHHRTPEEIMRTLVRNARVEVLDGGVWKQIGVIRQNRVRHVSIVLDAPQATKALRVVIEEVNDCRDARIVALRAYADTAADGVRSAFKPEASTVPVLG